MDIVKYTEISRADWDGYINQLPGATFFMTSDHIEFIMEYTQCFVSNESFLMLLDKKACGASVLCIEKDSMQENQLSWGGGRPCPAPYLDKGIKYRTIEKLMQKVMEHIEEIEEKHN